MHAVDAHRPLTEHLLHGGSAAMAVNKFKLSPEKKEAARRAAISSTMKRHWNTPSLSEWFWRQVDRRSDAECWLWKSGRSNTGYGQTNWKRKPKTAHRMAWELTHGSIQIGLCVLHRCDVRLCVNPSHLFLGTIQDNHADMMNKGRDGHGVAHGEEHPSAKLTEDQVRYIRSVWRGRFARGQAAQLASDYGVTPNHIWSVAHGRTWRHI